MSDGATGSHLFGLCNLFLPILLLSLFVFPVAGDSLERDQSTLIELRDYLLRKNPFNRGPYAGWNEHDPSPCNWTGVACEDGRVTGVSLRESSISCGFFDGFSNLTELTHLDLSRNTISGAVPRSLNRCAKLRHLNLSHNIIDGELDLSGLLQLEVLDITLNRFAGRIRPPNLAGVCDNLVTFNISLNNFTGEIGGIFDGCPYLKFVDLSRNRFSGDASRVSISSLEELSVSENFVTGVISPEAFPVGCRLRVLDLSQNGFSGEFPDSIANCSDLTTLNLWGNRFTGGVPRGIGSLPEMEKLFLGNNSFDRDMPAELLRCPKLLFLDLSNNNFRGTVQPIFGNFTQVKFLVLHGNNYAGGIESSGILRPKEIVRLDLSYNSFSGPLPREIAGMPKLKFLILAHNKFSGSIPPEFGKITTLQALDLSYNSLTGSIPATIGSLTSLLWLMLANNSLSGGIPPEIGRCRSLLWLNLANNNLSGAIPAAITAMGSSPNATFELNRKDARVTAGSGECLAMMRWIPADYPPFSFAYNIMTRKSCRGTWDHLLMGYGIFPLCAGRNASPLLRTLTISGYVQLTGNRFSGEIPPAIGEMKWLSLLHLNRNRFSGRLPPEIAKLPLNVLNVSENLLSGGIPGELGDISCLSNLDLSSNNFSGDLPSSSLNKLTELNKFNVSYNRLLHGFVPGTGQLSTFDEDSFLGDPHIVLGNTGRRQTPPPPPRPARSAGTAVVLRVFLGLSIAFFAAGILTVVLCLRSRASRDVAAEPDELFLMQEMRPKGGHGLTTLSSSSSTGTSSEASTSVVVDMVKVIRLDKTVAFTYEDLLAATGGFSDERVLGRGGFGVVYRGVLPDGRPVAVKRLQREGVEGEREFRAEMEVMCRGGVGVGGGWPHPNLVALYGWCLRREEKLLVFEYMEGGSLEEVIASWEQFGWAARLAAAIGVARALAFLHHDCDPAVVHRDVKASNVLLDGEGRARVTDFGLSRTVLPGDSHVTTVVAGTVGYVAPEYGQTWQATTKGDVYSFGVLAMELATGRRAVDGGEECLVEWARRVSGEGGRRRPQLVGGRGEAAAAAEVWAMGQLLEVGMCCTAETPQARPNMKEVLGRLRRIVLGADDSGGHYVAAGPQG